jgi:hypothetical protein
MDGNFDIKRLGHDVRGGLITYASVDKKDVVAWTGGVMSTMKQLKRWSNED